jgi:hypothetical protein
MAYYRRVPGRAVNEIKSSLSGGCFVEFDGHQVRVLLAEVREALTMLHKHSPEVRKRVIRSTSITLGRNWPKVKKGTASPRDMILTRQDISIWFANEVLAGRARIEGAAGIASSTDVGELGSKMHS